MNKELTRLTFIALYGSPKAIVRSLLYGLKLSFRDDCVNINKISES